MLNKKKTCNEENTIQDIDTIQINDDTKLTTIMKSFLFVKLITQ